MSFEFEVNYLAVLLVAVIDIALGAFWYSPLFLGKTWTKIIGKTEKEMEEMQKHSGIAYIASTFAAIITAFVLAFFMNIVGADTIYEGLQIAFLLWFGFVITSNLSPYLWEGRPKGLYFIYIGYKLVALLAMSIVLAIWQ